MESKLANYQPLSHSRRSKFEECPRAFSFSYLEKIPQTDSIYASVGTFIHSVIENFYKNPKNLNPRNYIGNDPLGYFRAEYDQMLLENKQRLNELYNATVVNNSFANLEDWLESLMKNYISIEQYIHDPMREVEAQKAEEAFLSAKEKGSKDSKKISLEMKKTEILKNLVFWPNQSELNLENTNLTMERKFDIIIGNQETGELQVTGFIDQLVQNPTNLIKQVSFFDESSEENSVLEKKDTSFTFIIDIKTSKPPKSIVSYEDQLNTYAMFLEKETQEINGTTENLNLATLLFFLGGEDETAKDRIFILEKINTDEIEKKFIKSKTLIEVLHTEDKMNFQNLNTEDVWETKPNKLCNWCWYKNLCPFWITKKNSGIEIQKLNNPLSKLRHSGGAKYGPERHINAEKVENINSIDNEIEASIKNLLRSTKKLQKQFDFFKQELELIDPLHEIKTEVKNFLGIMREEELSNKFSDFIKKFFIQFSSEKKDITIDQSWEKLIVFFNGLKNDEFLHEIDSFGHTDKYKLLREKALNEWSAKKTSEISINEILIDIEVIQSFLVGVDQIKEASIDYKVKIFDEDFINLVLLDKGYPLNEWVYKLNVAIKELLNKTQTLQRKNFNISLTEINEILDTLEQKIKNQSRFINNFLEKI